VFICTRKAYFISWKIKFPLDHFFPQPPGRLSPQETKQSLSVVLSDCKLESLSAESSRQDQKNYGLLELQNIFNLLRSL
jgi:hypothetical protein